MVGTPWDHPAGTPLTHPPTPPHPLRVHGALLAVSLLFGTNFPFTKEVVGAVPAKAWVCYRLLLATAILLPMALLRSRAASQGTGSLSTARESRGGGVAPTRPALPWGHLTLAAMLGVTLNMGLFTEGLARNVPGNAAVMNAVIPLWTFLFALVLRHEDFTVGKLLAPALGFGGVAVLLGSSVGNAQYLDGNLLNLANGMSFGLYLVVVKGLNRKHDPLLVTALAFAIGLVPVTVWAWPDLNGDTLRGLASVWEYAACLILLTTVLTYALNNWALQHAPSSQVAMYIVLQPVIASGLSYGMGLQDLDGSFLLALGLVLASLSVRVAEEQRTRRRRLGAA